MRLAENGHRLGGVADVEQWPWTWLRMLTYTRIVRNVYERAAMFKDSKGAVPPKWMFWEDRELEQWFDDCREAEREN